MKCKSCGKDCPEDMRFCGYCGKPLAEVDEAQDSAKHRRCVACGRVIDWNDNACQYCGHDYRARR